jgi:phytoene dehydrogenase-like protein
VAAGFDVIVVGGGHNGLVAAAYLGRAGMRVRLLERLEQVGGAAVSARVFDGVDARLSRYAYLVSLLPQRILDDLGARVQLARRPYSSYTPDPATAGRTGLLIDTHPAAQPRGFADFYRRCRAVTGPLWPTLLEPLLTRSQARHRVVSGGGPDAVAAWRSIVDEPIGHAITDAVHDELTRGVIATDALIGTFAALDDPGLTQNVCFLYHLLGQGSGEWHVPVGGMGSVTAALATAAADAGVEIVGGAEVFAVQSDGQVAYRHRGEQCVVTGRLVLAGVTPTVLAGLLGEPPPPSAPGAQVKVNMLVRRLPGLRDDSVAPEQAFSGTMHVNETWTQLQEAYSAAAAGRLPDPLPCEIYCHTLTDPSILSADLRGAGAHTLTLFGLHTPHSLCAGADGDAVRARMTDSALSSLNSVLAEPIADLLLPDGRGGRCIETKTTLDLERALMMTGGNIFHGGLTWPFAEDDETLTTPAQRWGVASAHERILLCGSGARRGGAVSGIGGHNAAMAAITMLESAT